MNQDNLFRVLEHFLQEFDGEVVGRGIKEMPAEILRQIEGLAEGRVDTKQRVFLVEELAKNPEWIGVLAEELKKRRIG